MPREGEILFRQLAAAMIATTYIVTTSSLYSNPENFTGMLQSVETIFTSLIAGGIAAFMAKLILYLP
mgnify:CR=1